MYSVTVTSAALELDLERRRRKDSGGEGGQEAAKALSPEEGHKEQCLSSFNLARVFVIRCLCCFVLTFLICCC